jgi:hypothetical protein
LRNFLVVAAYAGVVAVVAFGAYRLHLEMRKAKLTAPRFPASDVDGDGMGAIAERQTGDTLIKLANGDDWFALQTGAQVLVGTLFSLGKDASSLLVTRGNWVVQLTGPGEFVFETARTDAATSVHTVTWYLGLGRFRAKPQDHDPSGHWIRLRTKLAEIHVKDGEVGARLERDGHGEVWLQGSGEGRIRWKDGREKILSPKGMEHL